MVELVTATMLLVLVLAAPLLWRVWQDRATERALALTADLRAAAFRTLHGESFLAVSVAAATPWRRGRVYLSVPAGWEWLVEAVWPAVVARVPAGYEIVVRPTPRAEVTPALPRAA